MAFVFCQNLFILFMFFGQQGPYFILKFLWFVSYSQRKSGNDACFGGWFPISLCIFSTIHLRRIIQSSQCKQKSRSPLTKSVFFCLALCRYDIFLCIYIYVLIYHIEIGLNNQYKCKINVGKSNHREVSSCICQLRLKAKMQNFLLCWCDMGFGDWFVWVQKKQRMDGCVWLVFGWHFMDFWFANAWVVGVAKDHDFISSDMYGRLGFTATASLKVPQIEIGMFNKSFSFECYIHIFLGFQDKLQGNVSEKS